MSRVWTKELREEHKKLMRYLWRYDKLLISAGLKPKTNLRNKNKTQIKIIFEEVKKD